MSDQQKLSDIYGSSSSSSLQCTTRSSTGQRLDTSNVAEDPDREEKKEDEDEDGEEVIEVVSYC